MIGSAEDIQHPAGFVTCPYCLGDKMSGIRREDGKHSINFNSEPTNICIKL